MTSQKLLPGKRKWQDLEEEDSKEEELEVEEDDSQDDSDEEDEEALQAEFDELVELCVAKVLDRLKSSTLTSV